MKKAAIAIVALISALSVGVSVASASFTPQLACNDGQTITLPNYTQPVGQQAVESSIVFGPGSGTYYSHTRPLPFHYDLHAGSEDRNDVVTAHTISKGACVIVAVADVDHGFLTNKDRTELDVVQCAAWLASVDANGNITYGGGQLPNIPVAVANGDGSFTLYPAAPKGDTPNGLAVAGDFASTHASVYTWAAVIGNPCVYPVVAHS